MSRMFDIHYGASFLHKNCILHLKAVVFQSAP
jgi:hypothetical protein